MQKSWRHLKVCILSNLESVIIWTAILLMDMEIAKNVAIYSANILRHLRSTHITAISLALYRCGLWYFTLKFSAWVFSFNLKYLDQLYPKYYSWSSKDARLDFIGKFIKKFRKYKKINSAINLFEKFIEFHFQLYFFPTHRTDLASNIFNKVRSTL